MLSQAVTNCNGSEVSSTHRLSGALATAWGQLLGQRLSSPSLAGAAGARLSAFGVSALEPQFPHGDAQRRRVMSAHVERTLYKRKKKMPFVSQESLGGRGSAGQLFCSTFWSSCIQLGAWGWGGVRGWKVQDGLSSPRVSHHLVD